MGQEVLNRVRVESGRVSRYSQFHGSGQLGFAISRGGSSLAHGVGRASLTRPNPRAVIRPMESPDILNQHTASCTTVRYTSVLYGTAAGNLMRNSKADPALVCYWEGVRSATPVYRLLDFLCFMGISAPAFLYYPASY